MLNMKLDEARGIEEDLKRGLQNERDSVRQRDMTIEEKMSDITHLRKQVEDLNLSIAEMDRLRGELHLKFEHV